MNKNVFRFFVWVSILLASCTEEAPEPPLGANEKALVDAYVRLTVLQALHERQPDSTGVVLQQLRAEIDTTAIRNALQGLGEDPMRWEIVYAAMATRLEELEHTPALWWSVVHGDTLLPGEPDSTGAAKPVRVPIPSEREPDR